MDALIVKTFLVCSFFSLCACSTLLEVTSPDNTALGYEKQKNEKGEEVYRRERVVFPGGSALTPTQPQAPLQPLPTQPIYPPDKPLPPMESQPVLDTQTNKPDESSSGWFVSGELAVAEDYKQFGVDLGKEVLPVLDLRGGFAFFSGNDFYSGFDAGARAKVRVGFFEPFVGLGGYVGDLKTCSTVGFVEVCEKKFLYAGFTEVGASFWRISLFFRNYNIEEAGKKIPAAHSYGIGYIHRF
ncbi:MAG: hypothetical protein K2X47_16515 [Bdellovibrionales bacterium]|nr:hypothetical protein [Bdellovibrionales bacterium]